MRKKLLSLFLVLCMVCTMVPITVMAEETYSTFGTGEEIIVNDSLIGKEGDVNTGSLDEGFVDTGSPDDSISDDTMATDPGFVMMMAPEPEFQEYDLWVGGVRVNSVNAVQGVTGSAIIGSITYDPDEDILTLNNARITGSYEDPDMHGKYGIYAPGNLKLELMGESSIVVQGPLAEDQDGFGIYVMNNLTIFGDGKLVVTGGATTGDGESSGIHIVYGDLVIESGEVHAGGAPVSSETSGSNGICLHEGSMTIKEHAKVKAFGDNATSFSCGVCLEGENAILTLEDGGSLEALNDEATAAINYGLHLVHNESTLIVNGGSLKAKGGSGVIASSGISAANIAINGGVVQATGGDTTNTDPLSLSAGIFIHFGGTIIINGGAVEAISGSSTLDSYGISSDSITINGGSVVAACGTAPGEAQAMKTAPEFNGSYGHRSFCGPNAVDAEPVSDAELIEVISEYKYIEIKPYSEYDLWVGGLRVTSENKERVTGNGITGYVIYDPDENILTLNDARIIGSYEDPDSHGKYGIYAPGELKLELLGESGSSIVVQGPLAKDQDGFGIYVMNNLTIFGDGKLTVTGGATTGEGESSGIHIENGDLTIESGEVIAGGAPVSSEMSGSYGICLHKGSMTIKEQAKVKAFGDNATAFSSGVCLAGPNAILTLEDGASLEAVNDEAIAAFNYGIFLAHQESTLIVNGGSLKANGGPAVTISSGIGAANIAINGGMVEGQGGPVSLGISCGIHAVSVFINGGTVKAIGDVATGTESSISMSAGILITEVGSITINGGTVEALGDASTWDSYGINSDSITINEGLVVAASGTAPGISQAMKTAPGFSIDYNPLINAGSNGADAEYVAKDYFNDNISTYQYVEIEPDRDYDIWVGGVRVNSRNRKSIGGEGIEGYITYDPGNNILTLNDAIISEAHTEGGNKYGIYVPGGDLKLELVGDHSSIFVQGSLEGKDSAGIYVNNNLTIYGGGKLVVSGGATEGDHGDSYGIHIEHGNLTIDGVELITAGAPVTGSGSTSHGICIHDGNMLIKGNATVTARGAESDRVSYGLCFDGSNASLTVESGSSLEAVGGPVTDGISSGIHFENELLTQLIVNGKVTAIGGSAVDESCGIHVGKVIVNGGAILEASGGSAEDASFAICSDNIVINGGKVQVDSGEADVSYALTSAPSFSSSYSHRNFAGNNPGDATYVTDAVLASNINSYRYIEITPYTPVVDNGGGGSYTPGPTTNPTGPVNATVDSSGTANINITQQYIKDAIAHAKAEAEENGTASDGIKVVIHVSTDGSDVSGYNFNLPQAIIQQLLNSDIAGVELVIDTGITIGFDQAALREINRQTNTDVQISVTRTDGSKLSAQAKEAIGRRPVYNFEATYQNGNSQVTDFGGGIIQVSIPYTPTGNEVAGYLYIVYVDDEGNTSRISESTYDENNNRVIFITNHFSVYGVGYSAPKAKFTDIDTHWAKDCIEYVLSRELISGTKKTTFSPDKAITRAALVSALGKMAGIDVKEYTKNSFTDVKKDSPDRPYIEWAYSKGIIQSTDSKKFGPDSSVTRQELAAVMANYIKVMGYKLPASRSEIAFADAANIGKNYKAAVKAMQQAGIIMGKSDNKFDPKAKATRAEVSAMLHQLIMLIIDPTTAQGWAHNHDGQKLYYKNGKPVTGWQTIDDVTYFFNTDGTLKTGWVKDDKGNTKFYSGKEFLVGFYKITTNGSSKTYYFDSNGNLVSDKWLKIDGKWYYFDIDGMLTGNAKIEALVADEKGKRTTK